MGDPKDTEPDLQRYAKEFKANEAAGKSSCGVYIDGTWARCSRVEDHEGEHAALDSDYNVVVAWPR